VSKQRRQILALRADAQSPTVHSSVVIAHEAGTFEEFPHRVE